MEPNIVILNHILHPINHENSMICHRLFWLPIVFRCFACFFPKRGSGTSRLFWKLWQRHGNSNDALWSQHERRTLLQWSSHDFGMSSNLRKIVTCFFDSKDFHLRWLGYLFSWNSLSFMADRYFVWKYGPKTRRLFICAWVLRCILKVLEDWLPIRTTPIKATVSCELMRISVRSWWSEHHVSLQPQSKCLFNAGLSRILCHLKE